MAKQNEVASELSAEAGEKKFMEEDAAAFSNFSIFNIRLPLDAEFVQFLEEELIGHFDPLF